MISKKAKPETVSEYIHMAPTEARTKLREMRTIIRKAAPGTEEGMKWGMPSYSYKRILVNFAAFKHHIGFYPTASAVKAFEKDLVKYKTARGSIQFPLDKPIPTGLVRKITLFRVKESKEKDKKWRS